MKKYPLISVVILNWNRLLDTKRAIESVLRQTYPDFEIILIDNNSDEPGSDSLSRLYPGIQFYRMDKNYGCPGGRNIGIKKAKGDYIFFVDNDGILEMHALENAYRIFQENEDVGIVAGKIIFYGKDFSGHFKCSEDSPEYKGWYSHGFSGGVSMHKRSIYDKIGMYNADFMYGGEETNLSLRLLTIDQYVYYADNVVLWHRKSDSARPRQFNFISACSNMYYTYMQLMPVEYRSIFFLYFTLRYPFFALKNGYLLPFLKAMPGIYTRKRHESSWSKNRLTSKNVYLYHLLSKEKIKDYEELKTKKEDYSYWKYLCSLIFK